jgi:hypothetical protein
VYHEIKEPRNPGPARNRGTRWAQILVEIAITNSLKYRVHSALATTTPRLTQYPPKDQETKTDIW